MASALTTVADLSYASLTMLNPIRILVAHSGKAVYPGKVCETMNDSEQDLILKNLAMESGSLQELGIPDIELEMPLPTEIAVVKASRRLGIDDSAGNWRFCFTCIFDIYDEARF